MFLRRINRLIPHNLQIAAMCSSEGAIRAAGGAFGKKEAFHEEEFFRKKQYEAIQKLKADEIHQKEYHEMQIKEHEEAIERHKQLLQKMNKQK